MRSAPSNAKGGAPAGAAPSNENGQRAENSTDAHAAASKNAAEEAAREYRSERAKRSAKPGAEDPKVRAAFVESSLAYTCDRISDLPQLAVAFLVAVGVEDEDTAADALKRIAQQVRHSVDAWNARARAKKGGAQ